jgi:hypothetical protein
MELSCRRGAQRSTDAGASDLDLVNGKIEKPAVWDPVLAAIAEGVGAGRTSR